MQNQAEIIRQLLDTPEARKIAAKLKADAAAERSRITKRIAALKKDRAAALVGPEEALIAAKNRAAAAMKEFREAPQAVVLAGRDVYHVRRLYTTELRSLEEQLAALPSDEA